MMLRHPRPSLHGGAQAHPAPRATAHHTMCLARGWGRAVASTVLLAALASMPGCAKGPLDAWSTEPGVLASDADGRAMALRERTTTVNAAPPQDASVAPGDVEAYVALALAQNPSLRAARWRIERMKHRVPQAWAIDDPRLTVTPPVGEMAQTAAGEMMGSVAVSQMLPLPLHDTLASRARIAEEAVAIAQEQWRAQALDVAHQVRQAYWSHYAAAQTQKHLEASQQVLDTTQQAVLAQVEVGQATQATALRVGAERDQVQLQVRQARQRSALAASRIARLIGDGRRITLTMPDDAAMPTQSLEGDGDVAQQLALAAERSPAIAQARRRIEQYREQRRLAGFSRIPDLTVGATYAFVSDDGLAMSANGDDQWWLTFSINLPFDQARRTAAEREALAGVYEETNQAADLHNGLALEIEDALIRMESLRDRVELLRQQLIPQAQQTADSARASYQAAAGSIEPILSAWRQELMLRQLEHELIAQAHQAHADLRKALATDLPEVTHE